MPNLKCEVEKPVKTLKITPHPASTIIADTQLLAGSFALSLGIIFIKLADMQPATISFLRCIIAIPFLLLLSAYEFHKAKKHPKLEKNTMFWAFISGVVIGIQYIVYAICVDLTGAGISSVLANCQIFFFPIFALLIDKESIPRSFWFLSPLMLIGLSASAGLLSGQVEGITNPIMGFITGILSGVTYAGYLFLNRRCTRQNPHYAITYNTIATVGAGITCVIAAPFMRGFTLEISTSSWIWTILLALVAQVLAWILVAKGSHKVSPNKASSLLMTQPVITIFFGILFLSETLNLVQTLGCILVLGSVWAVNKSRTSTQLRKEKQNTKNREEK